MVLQGCCNRKACDGAAGSTQGARASAYTSHRGSEELRQSSKARGRPGNVNSVLSLSLCRARARQSARVSTPPRLVQGVAEPAGWLWRADLLASMDLPLDLPAAAVGPLSSPPFPPETSELQPLQAQPPPAAVPAVTLQEPPGAVWRGWFEGLAALFLAQPVPKLVALSGHQHLDTPFLVAQMQGKFETRCFPSCGHQVHEDAPLEVAHALLLFAASALRQRQ